MEKLYEVQYEGIEEDERYEIIAEKVINECFKTEDLINSHLYISITFTTPEKIKELNYKYRNINKETDVLSFPMFEKKELDLKIQNMDFKNVDILGDMVISIPRVKEQALEYGHSFERELAYMIVHSFYHLIGYDHINEDDKTIMRTKEEAVLNKLNITR